MNKHTDTDQVNPKESKSSKKYNIIDTIAPDAPFGYINWVNISFLTPQKSEKTKYLDVIGFKVQNGYTIEELADSDAQKIKAKNTKHDIYTIEMGKVYAWDDINRTENIEYENKELNNLEKTRRENADKLKLMREQFKNEHMNFPSKNSSDTKKNVTATRLRKRLYREGKITKKEFDLMEEYNKPLSEVKVEAGERTRLEAEATAAFDTDYLDVNDPVPLIYGCMSIFTPKSIKNLATPCLKIRGLFQTEEELLSRIAELEKKYPHDRIHRFKVGEWTVYSDAAIPGQQMLEQLNYAMKCHLDAMATEADEFQERKEKMTEDAANQGKFQKMNNNRERRKAKKEAKAAKKNKQADDTIASASTPAASEPAAVPTKPSADSATRKNETNEAILKLMDYLNDDELAGKYVTEPTTDKSNATVLEI